MNEASDKLNTEAASTPSGGSAEAELRCAVAECGKTAVCELAVDGEWFPICDYHAVNKFMPRRPLRQNDGTQRRRDAEATNATETRTRRSLE